MLYRANQVYLQDHWTPKSYCKRYSTKLRPWYLYQKSSSNVIELPFHITHRWQSSSLTRWLDTRKFTLICASIRITIVGWRGFWWINPLSSMKKCIVGAVAIVFPAFPRIWALPEHTLNMRSTFSQTWEAQFCFGHYLCSLSGRFFFKYPTFPDAVVTFTQCSERLEAVPILGLVSESP